MKTKKSKVVETPIQLSNPSPNALRLVVQTNDTIRNRELMERVESYAKSLLTNEVEQFALVKTEQINIRAIVKFQKP